LHLTLGQNPQTVRWR